MVRLRATNSLCVSVTPTVPSQGVINLVSEPKVQKSQEVYEAVSSSLVYGCATCHSYKEEVIGYSKWLHFFLLLDLCYRVKL